MRIVILAVFAATAGMADSFINKLEYGQMLYANPRGVSCGSCHGARGEGKILGTTVKKNQTVTIAAPNISTLSPLQLAQALAQKKRFMPTYYLTDEEVASLHYYLQTINRKEPHASR